MDEVLETHLQESHATIPGYGPASLLSGGTTHGTVFIPVCSKSRALVPQNHGRTSICHHNPEFLATHSVSAATAASAATDP